jgi:hypothetical protein
LRLYAIILKADVVTVACTFLNLLAMCVIKFKNLISQGLPIFIYLTKTQIFSCEKT